MSPNPYILLRTLVSPHRWFKPAEATARSGRRVEYRKEPTPGAYEYVPGRGWFLFATYDESGEGLERLENPVPVVYCRILDRILLRSDYEDRKKHGRTKDEHGRDIAGIFFRLDDGFTFIYRWDLEGKSTPCDKMQPYVVDAETGNFRVKVRGDCTVINSVASDIVDGSIVRSTTVASPSVRSFVSGDVHRPSHSSTTPSTRAPTRPTSSHGSSSVQGRKTPASTATTPSVLKMHELTALNGPELERRLKDLKRR